MTLCSFLTLSEHSTSLGQVRYQRCACGRLRVLLDSDLVKETLTPQPHAPHRAVTAVTAATLSPPPRPRAARDNLDAHQRHG